MNGYNKNGRNSNPNAEGPPGNGSENGQLQWVLTTIAKLEMSTSSLHDKLDSHMDAINKKLDSNNSVMFEKMIEKNKNIEDKIDSKHQILELKITNAHESIGSKHEIACEKMISLESSIINKIREEQRQGNRWIIGLLVAVFIGVVGSCLKAFL